MSMLTMAALHITPKAEEVFSLAGVTITNSHLMTLLSVVILLWAALRTRAAVLGRKKHTMITHALYWAVEGLYSIVGEIIPDARWARRVAPLTVTMFLFVAVQYWLGLLPIVGPLTVGEHHTPLFRSGVADLNMTLGLAAVTIIAAQAYAFKYLGFRGNMGRYFVNPLRDPIMSFVGILELVAEFSRLLGLSFRLFGNVLAGEVMLIIIAYLTQYVSPIALQPFYLFELFIGTIQAFIFFMLSTVFISLGLQHHGHDEDGPHDSVHPSPVDITAERDIHIGKTI